MKLFIRNLREFDFNPHEDIVVSQRRGATQDTPQDGANELDRNARRLREFFGELYHEIESEEEANAILLDISREEDALANVNDVDELLKLTAALLEVE